MTGPAPAVAKVRTAVRTFLQHLLETDQLQPGDTVLVACSGGADSLALASQLAFVAPRLGLHGGAVTVDHQFQEDSALIAHQVAGRLIELGLDPVYTVRATPHPGDPPAWETAARARRRRALTHIQHQSGARAIVLGHTQDDQAETVLIQLARGSGARSLAGMPAWKAPYGRPLLSVDRATTELTCQELGLQIYEDPTNAADGPWRNAAGAALPRAAVRHHILPQMVDYLGPGVKAGLVRTAALLADDAAHLDELAHHELAQVSSDMVRDAEGVSYGVEKFETLPLAILRRVMRLVLLEAGADSPTFIQVEAATTLITAYSGQGPVAVSGGVSVARKYGRLRLTPTHKVRS